MSEGWIKLHRQIADNPLWFSEKFSKAQAWLDLCLHANHKDGVIYIRGNKVNIKRGQLGWSELTMCKRWDWSKNKTRRFLKWLEAEQQIAQQKDRYITTIVTILNYNKYQSDTADDTAERQQKDSRRYINKNVKNVKNDKETNTSTVTEVTGVGIANEFKTYIQEYNGLMEKRFQPLPALLAKYKARRKTFSKQEIYDATLNLYRSPYHMGDNERGTFYATPDFILRSDSQIDKWKDSNNVKGVG